MYTNQRHIRSIRCFLFHKENAGAAHCSVRSDDGLSLSAREKEERREIYIYIHVASNEGTNLCERNGEYFRSSYTSSGNSRKPGFTFTAGRFMTRAAAEGELLQMARQITNAYPCITGL